MSAMMGPRMKLALLCLCGLQLAARLAECQFLQPQSHLGRLVQSITSPLVLSSAYAVDSDLEQGPEASGATSEGPQQFQQYQQLQQQPQAAAAASAAASRQLARSQFSSRPQALQQAPSQERGVPQHFHQRGQQEGEEEAPSVAHRQRSNAAAQEYQMGAYLGPTIDDKEIQGAFNSKDDERDEDEGAAGFMGPQSAGEGGRSRTSKSAYSTTEGAGPYAESASYGPNSMHNEASQLGGVSPSAYDDDNSADEDDEPRARQPARFRSSANGLNQAASQYHQRRQQNGRQMQAAANGYAPYGYPAGNGAPIDLSSLMAAAAGGQTGGYEVYNGDGSYPGADYYQQQGNNNGRRRPAASNSMNAGPYGPYGQQQQQAQQSGRGDNDEQEADSDDD